MKLRNVAAALALGLLTVTAGVALAKAEVWEGKPDDWTLADVQEILNKKNPWVQSVPVTPGALKAKGDATEKPTATDRPSGMFVRWASSGILRQAAGTDPIPTRSA